MDATDAFTHHARSEHEIADIPADIVERAAEFAREKQLDGWLLRLDPPTYQAVMTHASDGKIRETFYRAWNTRASDAGPNAGEWDNGPLIEEILALRREAAELLGFESYAEQSIATKMAKSTDEVVEFLRDLASRSKDFAIEELEPPGTTGGRAFATLGHCLLLRTAQGI